RVIDDLGPSAKLVFRKATRGSENFERGPIVNVVAAPKGFDQRLVAGQMRQNAKLDLRVVGGNQKMAWICDERAADFPSELGPNGNVLEVGIAAAQSASRRHGLVETRVHTASFGVDELWQGVDVGSFELLQRAPFENQSWQVVRQRQLLKDLDCCRCRLGLHV